ncbi:MAG: N-acetyltransferase [Pseudomonadota bacterium]
MIRDETAADVDAVQVLTAAAFAPMAFSDGTEASALATLREAGDLRLSLVAIVDDKVVGHAAFSPVFLDGAPCNWIGLGPIAVAPIWQKQGIGTALVAKGAGQLQAQAAGIVLIGNPRVYGPMGFVSDGGLTYRDVPARVVQYLPFGTERPVGRLTFSPGLENA